MSRQLNAVWADCSTQGVGLSDLWSRDVPLKMVIKKYAHGEVKFSLVAGTVRSFGRNPLHTMSRIMGEDPQAMHVAGMEKRVQEHWQAVAQRQRREQGFLDCSEKFAGARTPQPGYGGLPGRKQFGSAQRVAICEVGAIAEEKFGRSGVMLTHTIPGSGDEIARTVAEYSGYVIKRLRQWLRDVLQAEHAVIGVWEFQKRGMLHLHLAVMSHNVAGLHAIMDGAKDNWARILDAVRVKSGVNLCARDENFVHDARGEYSQQDAQWIKKSVARYFSKYTSKSARQEAMRAKYYPSRWCTYDRATRREALERRVRASIEGFSVREWEPVLQDIHQVVEDAQRLYLPGFEAVLAIGKRNFARVRLVSAI